VSLWSWLAAIVLSFPPPRSARLPLPKPCTECRFVPRAGRPCSDRTYAETPLRPRSDSGLRGDLQMRRDRTRVPFGTGHMALSHPEDRSNLNRSVHGRVSRLKAR
jgi:hypothetical protein